MDENDDKPSSTDDEQSKSGFKLSKMLILGIVVVVAVVGVTAAFLMHMNNYAATSSNVTGANNTSTSVNQTQPVYQATWHNVTSFSGSRSTQHTFNIKGERFKIVMAATPYYNYRTNSLKVEISGPSGYSSVLGAGELNWMYREGVKNKEITVEVTGTPGTYTATVSSYYIRMWNVTVYDYY